jgi:AcrR family transcriptional regulator
LLLVAARDIFNAGGPDASLEAVARAAGVGIGTLYRHFPTREALFQAVYRALAPAAGSSTELFADSAARLTRSVGGLMSAGVAAGQIRGDVEAEDMMRAVFGMCYTREQPGWQDGVIRLVDIFVDGLRIRRAGAG